MIKLKLFNKLANSFIELILSTKSIVFILLLILLQAGCMDSVADKKTELRFPETKLGIEIKYSVDEFFLIRDDLIHFAEINNFEPTYRDKFLSEEENLFGTVSFWMVNKNHDERSLFNYGVYLSYIGRFSGSDINSLTVRFIVEGFEDIETLDKVSVDFIQQFVTDKGKTYEDVTSKHAKPKGR